MDTRVYPNTQLHIDGEWCAAALRPHHAGRQSGHRRARSARSRMPRRADLDARARGRGARASRPGARFGAFERYKIMRKAADLLRERADEIAPLMTHGAGQAARRGEEGDAGRRRHHRLVRRGRPPRLRPRHPGARRAASTSSSSRSRSARSPPSRRGISRSTRRCARSRPRSPPAARSSSRRRRRRRPRRAELIRAFVDAGVPAGVVNLVYGVPAEISELPDPAPGHPQDLVHRLDRGRQAARGARRPAHEARDDGARRPCAGDRLRRRRRRRRREAARGEQVPQRRPGLRLADALPRAGEASTTSFVEQVRRRRQGAQGRRRPGAGRRPWARSPTRAASQAMEALRRRTRRSTAPRSAPAASRIGNKGNFFEPTVLTDVPQRRAGDERGAVRPAGRDHAVQDLRRAVTEANRLPYGLAAYAYTRSAKTATAIAGAGRDRHDLDQPPRPRAARGAVRRRQGFRLRLRGRHRGDRGLPEHQVHHPGRHLTGRSIGA